LGAEPQGK